MASTCASCGETGKWKHCGRCKRVLYCSPACQTADWKEHKKVCSFNVGPTPKEETSLDALAMLRRTPSLPLTASSATVTKAFNVPELGLAVLSLLSAKDLLAAQGVCRVWYRTIALEVALQQSLFFAPGPGELVLSAYEGTNIIIIE